MADDLYARDRILEIGGEISNDVIGRFVAHADAQLVPVALDLEPASSATGGEFGHVVVELQHEPLGLLRKSRHWSRVAQLSGVDRHEVVADALDLPEALRPNEHRDAE